MGSTMSTEENGTKCGTGTTYDATRKVCTVDGAGLCGTGTTYDATRTVCTVDGTGLCGTGTTYDATRKVCTVDGATDGDTAGSVGFYARNDLNRCREDDGKSIRIDCAMSPISTDSYENNKLNLSLDRLRPRNADWTQLYLHIKEYDKTVCRMECTTDDDCLGFGFGGLGVIQESCFHATDQISEEKYERVKVVDNLLMFP